MHSHGTISIISNPLSVHCIVSIAWRHVVLKAAAAHWNSPQPRSATQGAQPSSADDSSWWARVCLLIYVQASNGGMLHTATAPNQRTARSPLLQCLEGLTMWMLRAGSGVQERDHLSGGPVLHFLLDLPALTLTHNIY
jgi:hypothetical protein